MERRVDVWDHLIRFTIPCSLEELADTCQRLEREGEIRGQIGVWLIRAVRSVVRSVVVPEFIGEFPWDEDEHQRWAVGFICGMNCAYLRFRSLMASVQSVERVTGRSFAHIVVSTLRSALLLGRSGEAFNRGSNAFFKASFAEGPGSLPLSWPFLSDEEGDAVAAPLPDDFSEVCTGLQEMGFAEAASPAIGDALMEGVVKRGAMSTCDGDSAAPALGVAVAWAEKAALPWLRAALLTRTDLIGRWKARAEAGLYHSAATALLRGIFDALCAWPSSAPVLEDTRAALLAAYGQGPACAARLRSAISTQLMNRLMQPGADTVAILMVLVSSVSASGVLEPDRGPFGGPFLRKVSSLAQVHLSGRPDSIPCLVAAMLGEEKSEEMRELSTKLNEEMVRPFSSDQAGHESDDDGMLSPEPHHRLSVRSRPSQGPLWADPVMESSVADGFERRPSAPSRGAEGVAGNPDVVRSLVLMTGGCEAFAEHLKVALARRLLRRRSPQTASELRLLECLKMRFGDALMQAGEVMLKDADDSRRLLRARECGRSSLNIIEGMELSVGSFLPLVASRVFWPDANPTPPKSHPSIARAQEDFAAWYVGLKRGRSLRWRDGDGVAKLAVDQEFSDGSIRRHVLWMPVTTATAVLHMRERESPCLAFELAQTLGVRKDVLVGWLRPLVLRGWIKVTKVSGEIGFSFGEIVSEAEEVDLEEIDSQLTFEDDL